MCDQLFAFRVVDVLESAPLGLATPAPAANGMSEQQVVVNLATGKHDLIAMLACICMSVTFALEFHD